MPDPVESTKVPSKKAAGKRRAETPLMAQYNAIKAANPDAILLFRVGDFYETFSSDAIRAAEVLGIVLTKRSNGSASEVELAGFPYHALDTYLPKLVRAGLRVAICEQLEDPKKTKKLVKRGVTELVTPGVTVSEHILEYGKNNFLAALAFGQGVLGLAMMDLSTGEFLVAEGDPDYMDRVLQAYAPSEVLVSRPRLKEFRNLFGEGFYTYHLEEWIFEPGYGRDKLLDHFRTASLKGFGVEELSLAQCAAGAVIHYLGQTAHDKIGHVTGMTRLEAGEYVWLDRFTIRNLELLEATHRDGKALVEVMDSCRSPMGSRTLRRWLVTPLTDAASVSERHDVVEILIRESDLRERLDALIPTIGDLERLLSRVALGKAGPRDLHQLRRALHGIEPLFEVCNESGSASLQKLVSEGELCLDLRETLDTRLADDPPAQLSRGGVIRSGADAHLDELRSLGGSARNILAEMQAREAGRTGIGSLKVGFNNVFGYYLEVTNKHKDKVPVEWVRKQTLVNAERYITPELKEWEEKILGAEAKIAELEAGLFEALLERVREELAPIQADARIVARLDVLRAFADNALRYSYRRPELRSEAGIAIRAGRHPVIERQLPAGEAYVPNDISLDPRDQQLLVITGPNMAGKSALLRQTALIAIMAQCGSFVPAAAASIGMVDKVFTRVGASDNLAAGESTFLVEMNETASILNNLSSRSLILLDEIGRGTSTYDGISIAWALAEYLHENGACRPLTLFATHYHELNELSTRFERIHNFHVSTRETGGRVVFLRKLLPGGTEHSFGIHVAEMAGMPPRVLTRAREVLAELEKNPISAMAGAKLSALPASAGNVQLSMFQLEDPLLAELRKRIEQVDPDHLTPVDALLMISELRNMLKE